MDEGRDTLCCDAEFRLAYSVAFGDAPKWWKMTPMYGPAVRCKRISSIWGHCGLASMYPASDWSALCSGPSWISARLRSHYRTGLDWGHSGHQGSQAPGRPVLHLVSSSRRPRRVNWATSSTAPVVSVPLFGPGDVPSSRPAVLQRAARKGRQGRPSLYLASCFGAARPRLDGRGHGARIRPAGIKSQMRVPC